MQFADIPQLHKQKDALRRNVARGHIPHAQMFLGIQGSAALPMALAFAAYVMCEQPKEDDSCGVCPNCSKIRKAVHPDVHFVYPVPNIGGTPAISTSYITQWRSFLEQNPFGDFNLWTEVLEVPQKQLNISKAESHQILSDLSLKSYQGGYKMMIIWLPEFMHSATANALLKVLEEPPDRTLFILVCADIEAVIGTIISRCQVLNIPPFTEEELRSVLSEKFDVKEHVASEVALMAGGSLSEALRIINGGEAAYSTFFMNWLRNCYSGDPLLLYDDMQAFHALGKAGQRNMMSFTLSIFRGSLLHRYHGPDQMPSNQKEVQEFVRKFSKLMEVDRVMELSSMISEAYYELERNIHPPLVFLQLSLQLRKVLKKNYEEA
jgi:DNA polymerase-3 subunit delta'